MFLFDWDRSYYTFSRTLKDVTPYEFVKDENKTIIIHNIVGLSKDDISVSLEKENKIDYLKITGEKKNAITNKTYSVSSRFGVDADEIDNIEWYVEDGILYITVWFKKPEKPNINITYKK